MWGRLLPFETPSPSLSSPDWPWREQSDSSHDLPHQWWCLVSFLPREPAVLVLRSRPHGPLLPANLRLPKQPHRQRGCAAHEGQGALGGCAPVCQPPARCQQQPPSSCQTRPWRQPGQAALSGQGAHGRGEECMRPDQRQPLGPGQGPAARALLWGELQCGCAPAGHHGATRDPEIRLASLAAFHVTLLFLHLCRFIPLIYQHYLCLETFVKLFLGSFHIPGTSKRPGSWLALKHLSCPSHVRWRAGCRAALPDTRSGAGKASRHHLPHHAQQR